MDNPKEAVKAAMDQLGFAVSVVYILSIRKNFHNLRLNEVIKTCGGVAN